MDNETAWRWLNHRTTTDNNEAAARLSAALRTTFPMLLNRNFIFQSMYELANNESMAALNAALELLAYDTKDVSRMRTPECASVVALAEKLTDYLSVGNFDKRLSDTQMFTALENLAVHSIDRDVRLAFLHLVPLMSDGHPKFRRKLGQSPLFQALVDSLDGHRTQLSEITLATLNAISACVQSSEEAMKIMKEQGVEKFMKIIGSMNDDVVAARAARYLALMQHPPEKEKDCKRSESPTPSFKMGKYYLKLGNELCETLYYLRVRKECLQKEKGRHKVRREEEEEKRNGRKDPVKDALDNAHDAVCDRLARMETDDVNVNGRFFLVKYVEQFKKDQDQDANIRAVMIRMKIPNPPWQY